jgi:hypothetical protein
MDQLVDGNLDLLNTRSIEHIPRGYTNMEEYENVRTQGCHAKVGPKWYP